jgi:DUF4097 and DUF4098 domain-containing protein YvlB
VLEEVPMKRCNPIVLSGLILSCVFSTACYFGPGAATATEREEKTIPLPAGGSFRLENVNGGIRVESWDRPEVHVIAEKKARAVTEEKAREALAKAKVVFGESASEVTVETVHPKRGGFSIGTPVVFVEYTVQVPQGTAVSVTTVNGPVEAKVPGSNLRCQSVNGAVEVAAAASLRAESVNGRVEFRAVSVESVETTNGEVVGVLDGPQAGPGSIRTVNGSLTLSLGPQVSASLAAENVNGSFECAVPGLEVQKHRASGKVGAGGPDLTVETVNGSLKVSSAPAQ